MTTLELIGHIRTAFREVPKPTYTLADAAVADDWGDESSRFEEHDQSWEDIPDEPVARTTAAFCFLPISSWKYYIPAYMTWSIHHVHDFATETPQHLVYTLTNRDEVLAFRDSLTHEQRLAVVAFLEFWRTEYPDDIDDDEIAPWNWPAA